MTSAKPMAFPLAKINGVRMVFVLAFVAGCTTVDATEIEARREAELPDIYETVFRYQFEHNGSVQQANVDYYFLSITPRSLWSDSSVAATFEELEEEELNARSWVLSPEDYDPAAEFLARFKGHSPLVQPRSMTASEEDPEWDRVRHKNGGSGLSFDIYGVRWIDDDTVEVDGGYHESGRSGSTNIYRVERHDGDWVITKDMLIEVS